MQFVSLESADENTETENAMSILENLLDHYFQAILSVCKRYSQRKGLNAVAFTRVDYTEFSNAD